MDAHLASVESNEENNIVNYAGGCFENYWLGLVETKSDGTELSWFDGTPLNFKLNDISNPFSDGADRYRQMLKIVQILSKNIGHVVS